MNEGWMGKVKKKEQRDGQMDGLKNKYGMDGWIK